MRGSKRHLPIRNRLRRLPAFLLAVLMLLASGLPGTGSIPARAEDGYIRADWMDTSVSMEQYQRVMDLLRATAGADTSASEMPMYDTGLTFASETEAIRFCYNMKELFFGDDDFGVCYNTSGYPEMTVRILEHSSAGMGLGFHASGTESRTPTVFVGWLPGSDPARSLRQHDDAMMVLRQIVANAPADDEAAYRYFFEWLCEHVRYDDALQTRSHSIYSALVDGCSVCEGYARSFAAMCWLTGRYCRNVIVGGYGPGGQHERCVVLLNGVPKWIDVTWGDRDEEGIAYDYLLYDMDLMWRQQMGL